MFKVNNKDTRKTYVLISLLLTLHYWLLTSKCSLGTDKTFKSIASLEPGSAKTTIEGVGLFKYVKPLNGYQTLPRRQLHVQN